MIKGTGFSGTTCRQVVPDRSLKQAALRLAHAARRMLPPGRAARLAAAREHARKLREVHSRVTHDVTAMVVQADATRFLVDETADRAQAGLRAIAETGRQAIADLRDLIEIPAPWQSPARATGADAPGCPAGCCRAESTGGPGRWRVWRRRWIRGMRRFVVPDSEAGGPPRTLRRTTYRKPRFFP